MKKILIVATGGTISSLNKGNGLEPSISGSDIIKYCPELKNMCEVDVEDIFALDSTNIRVAHWIAMAETIEKNYSKSYFAFGSINFPELGHVYDNKVTKYINDPKPQNVKFYDYLNPNVGLIKFIPGMKNDVLRYLIDQYDGLVIETFGVGGLPEYSDFYKQIERAISLGKMVVLTTQVPNEGSNLSVYKVGNYVKNNLNVFEAHDMTTESALCKLMWVLAQTEDIQKAESLFYKTIGYDILFK